MLVSIVIPCHNCALTIDRAVQSVFAQSYENWELILVNNNSKDNTWEKLKEIEKLNPEKAISILDEEKKGAPAARNKGLHHAKGEWIQFLDADDELLSEKIELQLALAKEDQLDVIYGSYFKVREIDGKSSKKQIDVNSDLWSALIGSKAGITSANLFRKRAVLEVNGWDETKTSSQEYNLMFRMAKNNPAFSFINRPLAIIHFIEDSISNSNDRFKLSQRLNNFGLLRTEMLKELHSKNNYSKYIEEFNVIFNNACFWYFNHGLLSSFFIYHHFTKNNIKDRLKTSFIFVILMFKKLKKSLLKR